MNRKIFAAVSLLALASCSSAPVPTGDIAACSAALFAAGTANPQALLSAALATPACQRLAADALQALIGQVSAKQAARGMPR